MVVKREDFSDLKKTKFGKMVPTYGSKNEPTDAPKNDQKNDQKMVQKITSTGHLHGKHPQAPLRPAPPS